MFSKKNLFFLPSEKAERKVIDEVSRLMNECQDSLLKDIAFKAIMVIPNLLLQKTFGKIKIKGSSKCIEKKD